MYIPGELGVRSEVNAFVGEDALLITPITPQRDLVRRLMGRWDVRRVTARRRALGLWSLGAMLACGDGGSDRVRIADVTADRAASDKHGALDETSLARATGGQPMWCLRWQRPASSLVVSRVRRRVIR